MILGGLRVSWWSDGVGVVLLVLMLGAACAWVVGGSGCATRGWWLVGLWSRWCRLSLVLGYFLWLSLGL